MRQVVFATGRVIAENFISTSFFPEGPMHALPRTITADSSRSGQRSDAALLQSFDAFYRAKNETSRGLRETFTIEPGTEEDKLLEQAWFFESAMQDVQKGRTVGATKEGLLMTTTYDTSKGDLAVMLEGFSMPFVLRQRGNEFQVVGDCYVHGIMDGVLVCETEDKVEMKLSEIEPGKKIDRVRKPPGDFADLETFTLV